MICSPGLATLHQLAARPYTTAIEIGITCQMTAAEVRARLVSLESRRLAASRSDKAAVPPRQTYHITAEGKRAAEVSDAKSTT